MPDFARELNALHAKHIVNRQAPLHELESTEAKWETALKAALKNLVMQDKTYFSLLILESDVKQQDLTRSLELEDFCASVQAKLRWLAENVGDVAVVEHPLAPSQNALAGTSYGCLNPEHRLNPDVIFVAVGRIVQSASHLGISVCTNFSDDEADSSVTLEDDEDEDEQSVLDDPDSVADMLAAADDFGMMVDALRGMVPVDGARESVTLDLAEGTHVPPEDSDELVNLSDAEDDQRLQ